MQPHFSALCVISVLLAAATVGCVGDDVDFGDPDATGSGSGSGQGGSTTSSGSGQGGASSTSSGQGATSSSGSGGEGGSAPECGDGVAQSGEACDGSDFGGQSCVDHGYSEPAGLSCNEDCSVSAEACKATCGDNVKEPGEACDDGNLEPGDSCTPSCTIPTGDSCEEAIGVSLGTNPVTISGTTVGGGMHDSTQCSSAGTSPDRIYAVTASADGFVTASLTRPTTDYDAQLYALTSCGVPTSGLWCTDAWDPNDTSATGGEVLSLEVTQGQTVYIVVDGYNGDAGNFELVLDLSDGSCADPVPVPLWPGVDMSMLGSITGRTNIHGSWGCGGNSSGDVIYEVTPQYGGKLEGRLPTQGRNYSGVLSVRTACLSLQTQLTCDYNSMAGAVVVEHDVTSGTPYYYVVDGYSGSEGSYRLELSP